MQQFRCDEETLPLPPSDPTRGNVYGFLSRTRQIICPSALLEHLYQSFRMCNPWPALLPVKRSKFLFATKQPSTHQFKKRRENYFFSALLCSSKLNISFSPESDPDCDTSGSVTEEA